MKQIKPAWFKYSMLAFAFLLISFIDFFYRKLFSSSYHPLISLLLVILSLAPIIYISHVIYLRPYKIMLIELRQCYKDMLQEVSVTEESSNKISLQSHTNSVKELFDTFKTVQNQQMEMLCHLKNKNTELDQNNKFANAIVQITSEILHSGDLHDILQLILNKAIEIIPNAQKGSILLFNKDHLEFKAMYGYDLEALRDFSFSFNEIYQANAKDIYEPIIIRNVEEFNANLNKDKYHMLEETRSFELKSAISCAISVDNQFYGTINIDNSESDNAFIEEHKPIIKYFAEQIGIALKNTQLIEKILYLSQYDSLTNICNRAYFEQQLNILHKECEENQQSYTLVVADLNDLKLVNDTYGHEAGDQLIIAFTEYISSVANRPKIFGRIGGDEFALIYINKSDSEVIELIEDIKSYFSTVPFSYSNKDILNITFGYGLSSYPQDAADIPALFKIADQRMYEDKRESKLHTK